MDISKQAINPNPREGANPFSIWLFTYTIGMFKKGYSKDLEIEDLYNPLSCDKSTILGDRLESKWLNHVELCKKRSRTPSLLRVLISTFASEYSILGLLCGVLELAVRLVQPLMLGKLLEYFKPTATMSREDALAYAGIIVGLNAVSALLINQYIMCAFHYGMKVRAACCALIYRKALRLSRTALGETASGKVVNLLSNDVSRFDVVSVFLHHMWIAPTSALIVTYFLYEAAGYAAFIGIATVFVVVPLQAYTGKLSSRFRLQTALKTDERVRLMDEIIAGIQVIKMYAWEIPFTKLIKKARRSELKIVTKTSYVRGLFMTFNLFTTRAALFAALVTIALTHQEVTAAKVFVFMSFFNILSHTMSSMFVRGISEVAEVLVAIKRLQTFMLNEEYLEKPKVINTNFNNINENNKIAIYMHNANAKWNFSASDDTLIDMNVSFRKGKLFGIIGPVGAGKSSFLQTILGELHLTSGNMDIDGKLSYASQDPWVFAATVRQNILFGLEYNKKRYNEVVRVCALEKDFQQLPYGDLSIVGDRGASLSGGQKARINLARAAYRQADIYLFDDPLSAVDTHVAKHLYDECINGYLGNKTRILVTHQVQHLKDADQILILKDGKIEAQGSFHDLATSEIVYAQLLTEETEQNDDERLNMINNTRVKRQQSSRSKTASITSMKSETSIVESIDEEEENHNVQIKGNIEESSKGKVQGSLGLKYLNSGGNYCFVFFVIILYILAQLAASGVDWFVSFWVNVEELRELNRNETVMASLRVSSEPELELEPVSKYPTIDIATETCVYIYSGLIVALFVIAITRSMLFYKLCMKCSQVLHDSLFYSVVNTTMRFFDTNPSGRILNRFSKDVGGVDELLPKVILDAGQIMLSMVGSVILVAVVNPYFLIPIFVIGCIFMGLRIIFLRTSQNIKRLEGMTRSPVFTHLNATLQGLTTIRAFGAQNILRAEFDKHQDLHTSAWYMFIASSSAFGWSLDILCFIFTGLVTFSFLFMDKGILGGEVGLAVTQSAALTGLIQWGMRQSAEVANQLMSVERLLEYDLLPKERQPSIPREPSDNWPKKGGIKFISAGLRYDETEPLVLKNLELTIRPNEKIGIVGRTGAGKSSLISALFRLAIVEGTIEIDGIDTSTITLQELRSKISIIPQDPVLFSGTLRYNLDPFEQFADDILWKALEEVELKDSSNTMNKLESRVMDRGSNYSVGQRQLICLARAIVRQNKILMLDEATANVDPQTDALIQKTIRHKFADCTVLTVAHRLNTIMDSDRVLVMDSGTAIEFDHPHVLLKKSNSAFYRMVAETGPAVTDQLKRIARQAYESRHGVPT